jgi:ribosomal protein L14E/L6E/L27E
MEVMVGDGCVMVTVRVRDTGRLAAVLDVIDKNGAVGGGGVINSGGKKQLFKAGVHTNQHQQKKTLTKL